MPERKIRARGGAIRYRTVKIGPREYVRVAIVPKAGPRGGHTVAGKPRRKRGR